MCAGDLDDEGGSRRLYATQVEAVGPKGKSEKRGLGYLPPQVPASYCTSAEIARYKKKLDHRQAISFMLVVMEFVANWCSMVPPGPA